MSDAGADQFTFHIETTQSPGALCRKVRKLLKLPLIKNMINKYEEKNEWLVFEGNAWKYQQN